MPVGMGRPVFEHLIITERSLSGRVSGVGSASKPADYQVCSPGRYRAYSRFVSGVLAGPVVSGARFWNPNGCISNGFVSADTKRAVRAPAFRRRIFDHQGPGQGSTRRASFGGGFAQLLFHRGNHLRALERFGEESERTELLGFPAIFRVVVGAHDPKRQILAMCH